MTTLRKIISETPRFAEAPSSGNSADNRNPWAKALHDEAVALAVNDMNGRPKDTRQSLLTIAGLALGAVQDHDRQAETHRRTIRSAMS